MLQWQNNWTFDQGLSLDSLLKQLCLLPLEPDNPRSHLLDLVIFLTHLHIGLLQKLGIVGVLLVYRLLRLLELLKARIKLSFNALYLVVQKIVLQRRFPFFVLQFLVLNA